MENIKYVQWPLREWLHELIVWKDKKAIVIHSKSEFVIHELPNGDYDPEYIRKL